MLKAIKIAVTCTAFFIAVFHFSLNTHAQSGNLCQSDINQDTVVDLSDYSILASNFLKSIPSNPRADINSDGIVDLSDYSLLAVSFLRQATNCQQTATPTPSPTATSWNQDAHDAQRTGSSSSEPNTPWTFQWSFNGPDSSGGTGGHMYDAPKEARTIVGDNKLFVPAGASGIFALNLANGSQAWRVTTASFNAAPVYDALSNSLFAGGTDGKIYKFNATTGAMVGSFVTGSNLDKALLLAGNFVYAATDNGMLYKVNKDTLSVAWSYSSGSRADTPPSYSATRDIVIFATNDLNVHAVNNSSGSLKWRVKPTPNSPSASNTFSRAWPVVADRAGIVLLRMQLSHSSNDQGPNGGRFAATNAENRTWLSNNAQYKNLFALNLDTGAEKFIPAVGYGSTEDFINGSASGVMGSQPAVRTIGGKQVAYIHFRNGQTNPASDYRWSGHMGEMVLDDTTVPGLLAGDLRFVGMARHHGQGNTYVDIIDEQNPITLAGNSLFHAHWAASEGVRITDRSNSKGLTFASPITTSGYPPVMRAIRPCGDKNTTTHFASCGGLSYVTDGGRFYAGPGFWSYWDVADPPGWRVGSNNTAGTAYSAGFQARYTYVSNGYIIVQGNGGDILVFKHS